MNSEITLLYKAFLSGAAICTDTRNITKGCIFFALKGANFNGNTFALTAIKSGAECAVIDEDVVENHSKLVRVNDVLNTLQQLALHHRKQLEIPFIAITGSNGKTTTKELINRVLSKKFEALCTKGNLNNHIGVPLTLLSITNFHKIAIIEMGANHRKEIELLCSLAEPTHVLITNVGKAHLEGFGGFEGVKKGKGEMYAFAKSNNSIVFINNNNTHLKEMLGEYDKVVKYGTGEQCDVQGELIQGSAHVQFRWKNKLNNDWQNINTQLTGSYNFENILSAVAIGVFFGVEKNEIKDAIENYIPDNQRSQEMKIGSNHIVLDAYNANPTSMNAALDNFNDNFKGKRVIFLGEMLELGEASAQEHTGIVEKVKSFAFDMVVLVGKNFLSCPIPNNFNYFDQSDDAAAWVEKQNIANCNILIKGSRGSKMEKVLAGLKG